MSSFARRHIGPSDPDQRKMHAECGFGGGLDELVDAAARELRGIAAANTVLSSMIGLGDHDTVTPAVIRRNVLENPAWYTANASMLDESTAVAEAVLLMRRTASTPTPRTPHTRSRRTFSPARPPVESFQS